MEFWLTNGDEQLQLPVPPPEYKIKKATSSSTVVVLGLGEISFTGKDKLAEITPIETFFPLQAYSFCQYNNFPSPNECVDLIEKWRTEGTIIRFFITETKLNIECTVDTFEYGESDASGDIHFSLQLKEYKRIVDVAKEGWISSGGIWYYYLSNGTKKIGWLLYKDKWYYLKENGAWTGNVAGTVGQARRLEAIIIKLIGSTDCYIQYESHVQNIGWMAWMGDGKIAGTVGQGLRMEAIKIKLVNAPEGASIQYQVHVQGIGWMPFISDGQTAGTVGKGLRIEAIKITLKNMPGYSVEYQVQLQNIGWQDWASDSAI